VLPPLHGARAFVAGGAIAGRNPGPFGQVSSSLEPAALATRRQRSARPASTPAPKTLYAMSVATILATPRHPSQSLAAIVQTAAATPRMMTAAPAFERRLATAIGRRETSFGRAVAIVPNPTRVPE
jgi:hypothetical protein